MVKFFHIVFLLSFLASLANGQLPDTVHLKEVPIKETFTGKEKPSFDSLTLRQYQDQQLASLLATQPSIFIKQYGPGSLASVSFRGTKANHTLLFWNDVPLNSPSHGQVDLALYPVFLFDKVDIEKGVEATEKRPGALGGSISLDNNNKFTGLQYRQAAGSFGMYQTAFKAGFGSKNTDVNGTVYHQFANNDFNFINTEQVGNPVMKLPNASSEQTGVMAGLQQKVFSGDFNLNFWWQNSKRQIPPITTALNNHQSQGDEHFIFSGRWKRKISRKFSISASTSYQKENMVFCDPASGLIAKSNFQSTCNEVNFRNHITSKVKAAYGLTTDYNYAETDGYTSGNDNFRPSIYGGLDYKLCRNLDASMRVREQFSIIKNDKKSYFLPSLTAHYRILRIPEITLNAGVYRNIHLPTINDLYWIPGGNPYLLPEEGWFYQGGFSLLKKLKTGSLEFSANCYKATVDDWILWAADGQIWSAENISKVHLQGFEGNFKSTYTISKMMVQLRGGYSYTVSQTENESSGKNNQLIYVPFHQANVKLDFVLDNFILSYSQLYTGKRYLTSDNESFLPYYSIGKVSIGKIVDLSAYKIHFQLNINNVFDEAYQVMAFRPMPGRYFDFSVTIETL